MLNGETLIHWLWLSLFSSLLLGLYEVSRKAALRDSASLHVLLAANAGGLVSLGLALGLGQDLAIAQRSEFFLVSFNAAQHAAVLFKSLLVSTSWVLSYSAVKHLPITIAGPLRAVAPAFTVLGALVLFRETPTGQQWLGIGVIFLGYLGFARLGKGEGISYTQSPYVALLVLGTVVGAMSGLLDKYLLQHVALQPTTMQFWFAFYTTLIQLVLTCGLFLKNRGAAPPFHFTWGAPLAGVLLVVADQFYFRALAEQGALVSVVSLVRRSSVMVSFSLGAWLFKEQLVRKKSLALLVVLSGLLLLITSR